MCNHRDKKTGLLTIIPHGNEFICEQCGILNNKEKIEGDEFGKSWDVIKGIEESRLTKFRPKKN